jgi:hypothetical protein
MSVARYKPIHDFLPDYKGHELTNFVHMKSITRFFWLRQIKIRVFKKYLSMCTSGHELADTFTET